MSRSPRAVVLSAPQGSGKSLHAEELMRMFGCTTLVEEWDGVSELPDGALVLTNLPVRAV